MLNLNPFKKMLQEQLYGRIGFSTNGAGEIEHHYGGKHEHLLNLRSMQNNSKSIMNLNKKQKF